MTDWQSMSVSRGEDGVRRCPWAQSSDDYAAYHDDEWGRPVVDDVRLYGTIVDVDSASGRATAVRRVRVDLAEAERWATETASAAAHNV